jgi:signal peptidase I
MKNRLTALLLTATFMLGVFALVGPVQLGGPAAYVIVDGTSMEPTYADGDLVVARERTHYEIGDIVTFRAPDAFDSGFTVIHRIVGIDSDGMVTRGDSRSEIDPWTLNETDIIGASLVRVPKIGSWLRTLRTTPLYLGFFAGVTAFVLMLPSKPRQRQATDERAESLAEDVHDPQAAGGLAPALPRKTAR